jgi:hypothetical protein
VPDAPHTPLRLRIALYLHQGAAKTTKIGDPRGGWEGQRPKKDQGQIYFFDFKNNGIFELPSPRNAQKT